MGTRTFLSAICILSFGLALSATQEKTVQDVKSSKIAKQTGVRESHIRMDLLIKTSRDLPPAERNVFTPGRAHTVQTGPVEIPDRSVLSGSNPDQAQDQGAAAAVFFPNVRYVGFVQSPKKIVALIIFEGEPLAVEQGEILSRGMTVGAITFESIEIIGPNSQSRKYSFEGDFQ